MGSSLLSVLIAFLALTCGINTLQLGLGGFRFNRGTTPDPNEDPKVSLFELLDHLSSHYQKDPADSIVLSNIKHREEAITAPPSKFSKSPERCQITLCKVGDSLRLTAIDLLQPGLRKVEAAFSGNYLDEACLEISSYDARKLKAVKEIQPIFSRAFISGQLNKDQNQARNFKIVFSKIVREFLKNLSDARRTACTIDIIKDYLKNELASFSQTYQQKNFENGIAIKLASLQSQIEGAKRDTKDAATLSKKLDSVKLTGVHATIIRVPKPGLKHACTTKIFNKHLSQEILKGSTKLKKGRMSTFVKYYDGSSKSKRTGVSIVFLKRDRNNIVLAVFNNEFNHLPGKHPMINVGFGLISFKWRNLLMGRYCRANCLMSCSELMGCWLNCHGGFSCQEAIKDKVTVMPDTRDEVNTNLLLSLHQNIREWPFSRPFLTDYQWKD